MISSPELALNNFIESSAPPEAKYSLSYENDRETTLFYVHFGNSTACIVQDSREIFHLVVPYTQRVPSSFRSAHETS